MHSVQATDLAELLVLLPTWAIMLLAMTALIGATTIALVAP